MPAVVPGVEQANADAAARLAGRDALADVETMVRLYRGRVFRYLMLSLGDADTADTLTQDCFLKAYRAREQFRGECGLETWLMRIAVNLLRDHLRNRKLMFWRRVAREIAPLEEMGDVLAARESSAEDALLAREQMTLVWRAVERLPLPQREVFLLRFVEEKTVAEIAAITGVAAKTVKSQLYRGLQRVRAEAGGLR